MIKTNPNRRYADMKTKQGHTPGPYYGVLFAAAPELLSFVRYYASLTPKERSNEDINTRLHAKAILLKDIAEGVNASEEGR